jgi:molybdopterin converting factor small subunit
LIQRIIAYVRLWVGWGSVSAQLVATRNLVLRLQAETRDRDQRLEAAVREIDELRATLLKKFGNYQAELETARLLNKKLDAALQVELEAIQAKDTIVIPGLVAANQTLIDRWEAESAVHKLRSLHASAQRSE